MPSIVEMLLRTATLASERQSRRARGKADLLLTPPVEIHGVTDFNDCEAIVNKGYRYTVSVLEQLEKTPEGIAAIRGSRKARAASGRTSWTRSTTTNRRVFVSTAG